MVKRKIKFIAMACAGLFVLSGIFFKLNTYAQASTYRPIGLASRAASGLCGGGYAATGQISGMGYTTEVYDASNGLPTSDAMFVMGAREGHIFIGGYSGVIEYDGSTFKRLDTAGGLTSARGFFEDSKGRIWVGTNDNGVVILNRTGDVTHFTYKDGLPSSSIRIFEEDPKGNIFIGTTSGVCYVDSDMQVHDISEERLREERVLKLSADSNGIIYGQTGNGYIFKIENCKVKEVYTSADLGMKKISTILADPLNPGKVYIGTEDKMVFYGDFGLDSSHMTKIFVEPLTDVHWMNYDCGRVWVSSASMVGYLDEKLQFVKLEGIPFDSGIEMVTSDYQGNLWIASSTQGVMKLVSNNFADYSARVGLPEVVTNAVCLVNSRLYIGTDSGLYIINKDGKSIDNELTEYLKDTRIRCINSDKEGNIWIATYNNDKGLVCFSMYEHISSYTTENGLPDNHVRCITFSENGSALVGTNGGLAVIQNGRIQRTVGSGPVVRNSVFMTLAELDDGRILAGSDGDGIYIIDGYNAKRIGRDDGLTSDVIMKIVKDEKRDVYWIVTSNSIEYYKNGTIKAVTTFPYNNNYDIYFDNTDNMWILSSYGVYMVKKADMLNDDVKDYRLYTMANGLPYAVTSNSYSFRDNNGFLYIPGRHGVIRVDINNYYEGKSEIKTAIRSIYCDDAEVRESEDGVYRIPASDGRIQITASVMDYTMLNPTVRLYLEGVKDEGITVLKSDITPLEYTRLPYGDYTLHIQVLDKIAGDVIQEDTYKIYKTPKLMELLLVRVVISILAIALGAFLVWRIMHSTLANKQYEEIRKAKEEAERANTAKSRFLANMSHEIRTPINTITGMNEMIMREDPTGVPKGYFLAMMNYSLDIKNASESLLGLINDLLDMSKIESGKMHLVEQEYDVAENLRSIVSMIRVKSTEKELTFDVVVDELLPKRMYGDAGKIKQIVLNLLTNAVKYTSIGGLALYVSMQERNDDIASLRFSVVDTGMGVKEEDKEKLFTAYERLDEEKNSSIQGTGLGLDISRRFAELMGGNLWVESEYGKGSEFILTINQKIVDATPLGAFIEHDESKAKGPYVPQFIAPDADILVVDDNQMNLNVMKGLLKATKVFVTTSESGEDALNKIKDHRFNVVLLDHMMPGMDGIETVAEIRKIYPDLPVYALTANSTAGEEFYKSKGFNGYLSKPVEPEILEKTIMKHLPEEMMEKPTQADAVEEITEIPEDMKWIYETEGVSAEDGIKASGGVANYIYALKLFLDTIDDNSRVIKDAYDSGNIRLYTIKVHALKSSARIIGAPVLSKLAEQLEDAGNHDNMNFINDNTDRLLSMYEDFKEKLKLLKEEEKKADNLPPIPEDELKDAYSALADVIPQMDYDAVEMILASLHEYKLPDEDEIKMAELEKMLKTFDWDGMEQLMGLNS